MGWPTHPHGTWQLWSASVVAVGPQGHIGDVGEGVVWLWSCVGGGAATVMGQSTAAAAAVGPHSHFVTKIFGDNLMKNFKK